MNTKSLSFRLSLWVILSFLTATVLAFTGFYLATQKILIAHTDSNLVTHAVKVAQVASAQEIGMHDALAKEAFIRQFSEIPGMLVVIMDNQGVVVSSSTAFGPDASLYDFFYQAGRSRQPFFVPAKIGQSQMHVYVVPVIKNDNLAAVVLVGHPIDIITQSLKSLAIVLTAVFLTFVVPVAIGGYLLVKRGLRPVSDMAASITQISSSNLSARVAVPATGDQLSDLAIAFNHLLDRLATSFARERQFISDVAHEIKTPLSIVSTAAEIAISRPRNPNDYRKSLSEILSAATSLSHTLRHVLDLAWAGSDAPNSDWTNFSLSQLLDELAEVAAKLGQPKNLKIKSLIQKGVTISGKREKLYQAVLNLVDNAVKFTPAGGRITLSLTSSANITKITVSDTGVGIPASDLPHIFDRFYRGSKSEKTIGSGLGLAIASSIILAHGGQIQVKSQPAHGSTFTVHLPAPSS